MAGVGSRSVVATAPVSHSQSTRGRRRGETRWKSEASGSTTTTTSSTTTSSTTSNTSSISSSSSSSSCVFLAVTVVIVVIVIGGAGARGVVAGVRLSRCSTPISRRYSSRYRQWMHGGGVFELDLRRWNRFGTSRKAAATALPSSEADPARSKLRDR
uniref:Uncharacterized protein n=1 Tax=Anopheles farauti TaxID=69004 RepID=A0A182Q501_9DIPT